MIGFDKRTARAWSIMGINPCIWSIAMPEIMEKKENAVALTADLCRYSGMTRLAQGYPDRFFNFGIAEQNMVGAAAGMALEGDEVYMTTYAPFLTYRCADQMRHLIGNQNLNVTAVGSAAGLTTAGSGESLMALGDIALMRSINHMAVLSPADCTEMVKMMLAVAERDGPAYIRFCGTVRIPIVYREDYPFEIGKAVPLAEGSGTALLATGTNIVSECLKAAEILRERTGLAPSVYDFHTICPIDAECIGRIAGTHDLIVTVEEHGVAGGFGGAVAEVLAALPGRGARQLILGLHDGAHPYGSREYALAQSGLTADGIAASVMREYKQGEEA